MRTVLLIDHGPRLGSLAVRAMRSPFTVVGASDARPFPLSPDELAAWGVPKAVRLRGQLIRERLSSHEGIKEVLKRLDETAGTDVNPLFVALRDGGAELISWETLCNPTDNFVALDKRSPIGRISDPMDGQDRPPPTLRLPVKIMAIISALHVHGQEKEWDYLLGGLVKARDNGLDVRLKLLVGAPLLRKKIDAAIAGGLDWVEASHVDKTGNRVIQEINDWEPNIVHFFCHGRSDGGEQWIELATGSDYADDQAQNGTVKIGTSELIALGANLTNPWLLTLNCCDSGQATKDMQSMAYKIVSKGFPAVVAMLEPVEATDAYEFTRAFYRDVFASLARTNAELLLKPSAPFEWVDAMYNARVAIRDLHGNAEDAKEWTLPLLYVRGVEPLNFLRPHADLHPKEEVRDYKTKVRTFAEWLQLHTDDMDAAARQAIMQMVLADVPQKFWPNVDGTFNNDP